MGPTLFVHLRDHSIELTAIERWLATRVDSLSRNGVEWEFWPRASDCCQCSLAVVTFGAEADGKGGTTDVYTPADELACYEAALGYMPGLSLQFDNYCRTDLEGHELLAGLARDLCRLFGGMISLGGIDRLDLPAAARDHTVTVHFPDETSVTLIDADGFDVWLRSPRFFLEI